MSENVDAKFQQIGMFQLIKNMLSPRTLPHIAMIAILSTILLFLVRSQEVFVAISFISLAFSYLIVAALSNVEIVKNLTKLPEEKNDSKWIVRFLFSIRITVVPILIASVLVGLFWSITGGNDNIWVSPVLASLFIVWSIAQAASLGQVWLSGLQMA